jgi:hypothetical protein
VTEPQVTVHPVRYIVTVLPEDFETCDDSWYMFVVTVQYRGGGKYAVYMGAYESNSLPTALSAEGVWEMEGSREREDEAWLATHRFDLDTALDLARKAAPDVGVYSRRDNKLITAADLLEQVRNERS